MLQNRHGFLMKLLCSYKNRGTNLFKSREKWYKMKLEELAGNSLVQVEPWKSLRFPKNNGLDK